MPRIFHALHALRARDVLLTGVLLLLVFDRGLQFARGEENGLDPVPQAVVQGTFTYQGRLALDGLPAEGEFDMRVTIHDDPVTVTSVVPQFEGTVTVSNGVFSIQINAPFDGGPRWLAIEVKRPGPGAYELLSPRQSLTATPYALWAASGNFWQLGGNLGNDPADNFFGTKDDNPINIIVGNSSALRIEPTGPTTAPNIIGGHWTNAVGTGVSGAFVGGGGGSSIACYRAIIVSSNLSTVGGGCANWAGGNTPTAAQYSTVGGGARNTASGTSSTVAGGYQNSALAVDTSIGGGVLNSAEAQGATVSGGRGNHALGADSVVSGGLDNQAVGQDSTAGGGYANAASGEYSTVGGGGENVASAISATVSGGHSNQATGQDSTVGGGYLNAATTRSVVAGGVSNLAAGEFSTVPGGLSNLAQGNFSFAAGSQAKALHDGAFVWADSSESDFSSLAADTFNVRATGGVRISTNAGDTAGVQLGPGANSWSSLSDRNAKRNFEVVDSQELLDKLAGIEISTWNYLSQGESVRHIGPMAQDFSAAFAVGEDDIHINTVDADGVALAGVQGLYELVKEQELRIAELESHQTSEVNPVAQSTRWPFVWLALVTASLGALVMGPVVLRRLAATHSRN